MSNDFFPPRPESQPTIYAYEDTNPQYDAEKPVGEWNTFQVVCVGDTITVLVNGQEMNKTTGGQIGIQSEGAQLEVRRVTLEPAKS